MLNHSKRGNSILPCEHYSCGVHRSCVFLRCDYLMVGLWGGEAWKWQGHWWSKSTGPLSNVDLWLQLIELLEQQQEPVVFAKFGSSVQVIGERRSWPYRRFAPIRSKWRGGRKWHPPKELLGDRVGFLGKCHHATQILNRRRLMNPRFKMNGPRNLIEMMTHC